MVGADWPGQPFPTANASEGAAHQANSVSSSGIGIAPRTRVRSPSRCLTAAWAMRTSWPDAARAARQSSVGSVVQY
jgi:hypothetical protein